MKRREIIEHYLNNPELSVLVVGAGINGIGTFRDLALQNIDVLMIDRGDYCSGASAASSHMIHGGLRYLENGEFRLVREAIQERNRLLENAPHLVKPLPTVFPVFRWFSGIFNALLKFIGLMNKPAERGAVVIKLGMMLYDVYTSSRANVQPHKFTTRQDSLEKFPKLNPDVILTGTYYDAAMRCPERICIELIEDARKISPEAKALNYVSLVMADRDTVTLLDEISGEAFIVKPRIVINAAGPWIDFVNRRMRNVARFIGGTKGSHLVLDNPELRSAINDCEFFFENKDGRIVLIFPLYDRVLIGTSDIRFDDPDEVSCTEEEIDYFFDMVGRVFPSIQLDRSQIVFRFSGVRPLPYTEKEDASYISRDHSVEVLEPGEGTVFPIYSMVGGKWTTFRAFSEVVTDMTLDYLGETRKVDTKKLPIGGGKDYPKTIQMKEKIISQVMGDTGLPKERLNRLLDRYGTRFGELASFIAREGDAPLNTPREYSLRELAFIVEYEDVVHLDDLVLRRTLLAKLGHLSADMLIELAEIVGEVMGWSPDMKKLEIVRTIEILKVKHGVGFIKV